MLFYSNLMIFNKICIGEKEMGKEFIRFNLHYSSYNLILPLLHKKI